jgi:hypothetical protein
MSAISLKTSGAPMKQFLYCESTDGGTDHYVVSSSQGLIFLYGWMKGFCKTEDAKLARWMDNIAMVGEWKQHRMGICVRLRDAK